MFKINLFKKITLSFFIISVFLFSKNVFANTISDIMLVYDNNIIYINPLNLEKTTINNIEDLKKIIQKDKNIKNNNLDKNILIEQNNSQKDPLPFSDEIKNLINIQDKQVDNKKDSVYYMNELLNKQRLENNLNILKVDNSLTETAKQRCYNIIETNDTSDKNTNNIISRVKSNGSSANFATEILYWSNVSSSPKEAIDWWMNEPKYHKSNILRLGFNNIGSAICKSENSKNYFVTLFSD